MIADKALETNLPDERKTNIINRLKRLEGQVRGLQKMVEDERECQEILTLLSGVRSALNATSDAILETYLEKCQAILVGEQGNLGEIIKAVKLARG
jgi:CsoR family transcriptional regulator, copper-sensing transcriptional repressor